MDKKIIGWVVMMLIKRLQSEDIKKWIDSGLDILENKIKQSPNKYDDMALPLIALLREVMDVPDND